MIENPKNTAFDLPCFFDSASFKKKETVIGIIGKTQGVNNAKIPAPKASKNNNQFDSSLVSEYLMVQGLSLKEYLVGLSVEVFSVKEVLVSLGNMALSSITIDLPFISPGIRAGETSNFNFSPIPEFIFLELQAALPASLKI